jgi:hypothetical protein
LVYFVQIYDAAYRDKKVVSDNFVHFHCAASTTKLLSEPREVNWNDTQLFSF